MSKPTQFNPVQFMTLIKNRNPQELVMSMIKNNNIDNPILNDLIDFATKGDVDSVSKITQAFFTKQGKDFSKEFSNFMSMLK